MASKKKMSRRPRKRAQTKRKRHIIRKKKLRSVRRYRPQKRSARTRSRVPKRLPKRQPTKKVQMTRDAWGMLHSCVDGIYRKVSGEGDRLRKKERRPSILTSDVQTGLKQIMPKKESRRRTRFR